MYNAATMSFAAFLLVHECAALEKNKKQIEVQFTFKQEKSCSNQPYIKHLNTLRLFKFHVSTKIREIESNKPCVACAIDRMT